MDIAIIKDGNSDYYVIKQLLTAIYKHHHSIELNEDCFYDMESLNIVDTISKYITNSKIKYKAFSHKNSQSLVQLFFVLHRENFANIELDFLPCFEIGTNND